MEKWAKKAASTNGFLAEQTAAWKAYKKMKKEINLVPLDACYNDCHFNKESSIWHAKGNSLKKYSTKEMLDEWGIDENSKVRN